MQSKNGFKKVELDIKGTFFFPAIFSTLTLSYAIAYAPVAGLCLV